MTRKTAVALGILLTGSLSAGALLAAGQAPALDVTGERCSEAAVQALIDAAPRTETDRGPVVQLPFGRIRLCGTVTVSRRIQLDGGGTQLVVRTADESFVALAVDAQRATLRNFSVRYEPRGGGPAGPEDVAIDVRANGVRIQDVGAYRAGVGIRVHGTNRRNVNDVRLRDVLIAACRSIGVDIDGGDANGGSYSGFQVIGCTNAEHTAIGMRESSFLGNSHVGHAFEGNDIHLRVEGNANASTFVGIYVEGRSRRDPRINRVSFDRRSDEVTIIGGQLAHRDELPGTRVAGSSSRILFRDEDRFGHDLTLRIPAGDRDAWMQWTRGRWGGACRTDADCGAPEDTCEPYGRGHRCVAPPAPRELWEWRRERGAIDLREGSAGRTIMRPEVVETPNGWNAGRLVVGSDRGGDLRVGGAPVVRHPAPTGPLGPQGHRR